MSQGPVTGGLSIGEKLKVLRTSRGTSLDELARQVDLTPAVISQIERDVTTPPVGTLVKLAHALQVNVSYFFDEKPSEIKVEVVRANERKRIRRSLSHRQGALSYAYESLAFRKSDKKMEPFLIELDIDIDEDLPALEHEGEEFLFVLEGEVEAKIDDKIILLKQGDSLYFESQVPHALKGRGHTKPKALVVLYTSDA
ncbi:MAG: helix-turn-helix transcriptional regulator [Deltaproteobacteria bacterium]|nr:helix-turn-helix transcriptional regulator [Deltaproteobacteria bacterium]